MSESFIEFPVELNNAALKALLYEDMAANFPGWEANPNNPETWLIDSLVDRIHVPLGQLAADVAAELFYSYGEKIVKVQPIAALPATVKSTWKVKDALGYGIKAGTQVNVPTSGDTSEAFRVVAAVDVPKGSLETGEGEVLLEAIEPGTGANELVGEARPEDTLNFVTGIELVGKSTGGLNAEEPAEYLKRLAETMETLAPRPILPRDAEILARNIARVHRSLALDLFNPETDDPEDPETWDSERTVSVAVCDENGEPCTEVTKAAVKADLESKREVNFKFFVLDPTYTVVAVRSKVVAREGFDQATEEAKLKDALAIYFASNRFGIDFENDDRRWNHETTVRYQDVVTLVNNQQGIDHYTELLIAVDLSGLLPDPSFESGIKGWVAATAGVTYDKLQQSPTWASRGTKSMEVETTNGTGGVANARVRTAQGKEGFPVEPGVKYRIRPKFNVIANGGGKLQSLITWYKANGTPIAAGAAGAEFGGVGELEAPVEGVAPAEAAFGTITTGVISVPNGGKTHYFVDDVLFTTTYGEDDLQLAGPAPLTKAGRIEVG